MVFTVLTIFSLIGLLSYYIIFSRIKLSSFDLENNSFNEGISIIICAKNELNNIKRFFPSWINQEYPNFELIIVNDQSTDGSAEYLNTLALQYDKLKIVSISKDSSKELKGKRHALWQGIQAAENDYLFFTDADCQTNSKLWLRDLSKAFAQNGKEIIIGYSPYFKENSFLNKLVQYETFLTGLQYLAWAEAGLAYMSVGRNVAYKKSLLTETAFKNSNKSIGGDDDLIFQQLVTKENLAYCTQPNTIINTIAPTSYKDWILQKKRHLGAGFHYPFKVKLLLGFFPVFKLLFFISVFITTINHLAFGLSLFALHYIIFTLILSKTKLLNIALIDFIKHYTLIDIVYWFFYTIFVIASIG